MLLQVSLVDLEDIYDPARVARESFLGRYVYCSSVLNYICSNYVGGMIMPQVMHQELLDYIVLLEKNISKRW